MTGRHEPDPTRPAGGPPAEHTPAVPGDSQPAAGRGGLPDGQEVGLGFRLLPAGWMRGLLVTITAILTVVIALSDLTSAWVLVALPGSVMLAVAYLETLDRITRP